MPQGFDTLAGNLFNDCQTASAEAESICYMVTVNPEEGSSGMASLPSASKEGSPLL